MNDRKRKPSAAGVNTFPLFNRCRLTRLESVETASSFTWINLKWSPMKRWAFFQQSSFFKNSIFGCFWGVFLCAEAVGDLLQRPMAIDRVPISNLFFSVPIQWLTNWNWKVELKLTGFEISAMEFTGFIIIFLKNKQLTLSTEFATGDRTNERAPTNWTLKLNWCHWLRWTPADRKHQNGSDWHPKLVLEQRTKVTTWATAEVENWSVYQLTCDWCTLGAGHLVKGGRWINQPETTQKGKPQSNSTPRNGRKIFFFFDIFLIFFWYFFFGIFWKNLEDLCKWFLKLGAASWKIQWLDGRWSSDPIKNLRDPWKWLKDG